MECKARYRGIQPLFGVNKSETYTLEITTVPSENDNYLWVRIAELPQYLMPYGSVVALTMDWDFSVGAERAFVDQLMLADKWLGIYMVGTPEEVTA